jgi:hypothetical protein
MLSICLYCIWHRINTLLHLTWQDTVKFNVTCYNSQTEDGAKETLKQLVWCHQNSLNLNGVAKDKMLNWHSSKKSCQIFKILLVTYMNKHMCMSTHIHVSYMPVNTYNLTQQYSRNNGCEDALLHIAKSINIFKICSKNGHFFITIQNGSLWKLTHS